MDMNSAVWLLLITAIVMANIPFIIGNRLFLVINMEKKSFVVTMLEWFVYFILMGIFGYLLESKAMGNVAPQDWEFYAIVFFMFMIFAFPGFIYRYNLQQYLVKHSKS
jgi:hypothetical protein